LGHGVGSFERNRGSVFPFYMGALVFVKRSPYSPLHSLSAEGFAIDLAFGNRSFLTNSIIMIQIGKFVDIITCLG
jgi:hypothetical protein